MALLGVRCRRHTCKIVLFTSLAWCVADVILLLSFSDCNTGFFCSSSGQVRHLPTYYRIDIEQNTLVTLQHWDVAEKSKIVNVLVIKHCCTEVYVFTATIHA